MWEFHKKVLKSKFQKSKTLKENTEKERIRGSNKSALARELNVKI